MLKFVSGMTKFAFLQTKVRTFEYILITVRFN